MSQTEKRVDVQEIRNPPRQRPPTCYVMDDYYRPEVRELREKYELDKKVKGGAGGYSAL